MIFGQRQAKSSLWAIPNKKIKLWKNTIKPPKLTASTTVPHVTAWSFLKLIHIESPAVANPNIVLPLTAAPTPVIAHLTSNNSFGLCGMFAVQPSRRMCSTAPCCDTGFWHSTSSAVGEAIPFCDNVVIAFEYISIGKGYFSIDVRDFCVGTTLCKRVMWSS